MSRSRRAVFWLILLVLASSPLVLAELVVRRAGLVVSDDPYLYLGRVPSFFAETTVDGKRAYKVISREVYRERNVTFTAEKTLGTVRIFCIGSSASAGWPHPAAEIYSAYLQEALQSAYPDRVIEVLNVSAHAYASYRNRLIFEEIIQHDPDLVVVYTGNNEFLEKRTYRTGSHWYDPVVRVADHSVLFRWVRGSRIGARLFPDNTLVASERQHVVFEQWSKIEQVALDLRRDPAQLERVKEHYAYTLEAMVRRADRAQVPVVLLTLPVNLRDWRPNVSYLRPEMPDRSRWESRFRDGRAALLRADPDAAVTALREAVALAPEHADSHYFLGRAMEAAHKPAEAIEAYDRARDLDHNPFRAISAFNATLRDLAGRYRHVHLVDADRAFRAATSPRAPGFDLFLDYVHPSQRGNLVLARGVFEAILRGGLIKAEPASTTFRHGERSGPGQTPYDEHSDFPLQGLLVNLYVMMHQNEQALEKARYVAATPGAMAALTPRRVRLVKAVLDIFPELVDSERRELLGPSMSAEQRQALEARVKAFYRSMYPGYERFRRELATHATR
jgi:tetratricopeptide (TPR) repeat protein